MATRSSDLDDQKPGINIQTEGHTLTPPSSCNGPKDPEAFGSGPSCSPSQSPARKPTPEWPETRYCLEIWVTSTEGERATPPPPHAWQAPIVQDMVQDGKVGLREAVLTGPGRVILFYRQWSFGEGLHLGKAQDTAFTLSGAISWIGKQAQLSTKPVSLGDGWRLITQTITEGHIKPRGPGHPHSILPASTPFNFHNADLSPWPVNLPPAAEWWEVPRLGPQPGHQEQGQVLWQGWDWGQRQWELWEAPSWLPTLSSDHGHESDRSLVSTSSSVASMSERSGGSRHPCHGQWPHRAPGGHMKINLLVFKDEDTKDAITYQSWHWDLTVCCHAGCQDHTLLPYIIHSLQGYPGQLLRSSGVDISLDDVLTILDEHYSNVKTLNALNQELFQLYMGDKETVSDWGCICWDTSRFSQHHSWNVFLWIM